MKLFSKSEIKAIEDDLQFLGKRISPLMRINLRCAGSIIDANVLTAAGWCDQIKCEDGVEFRIDDSVRLEYAVKQDGIEYRAVVSIGASIMPAENASGWVALTQEERALAYACKKPRYSRMRWISAFKIDERRVKFEEIVDGIPPEFLNKVQTDLASAQKETIRPLIGDLKYQTEEFNPLRDCSKLSESELLLAKLESVIADSYKARNHASVKRLLTPLTRAVITDDDPCGHVFLKGIRKWVVVIPLVSYAYNCRFDLMAAVAIEILMHCDINESTEELVDAFGLLTVQLVRLGLYRSASLVGSSFAKFYQSDSPRIHHAGIEILCELIRQIRDVPADTQICEALLHVLEIVKPVWDGDLFVRMLCSALKIELKNRRKENTRSDLNELSHILGLAVKSYDTSINDNESAWKKELPAAIKSPIFWQAFLYCAYGDSDAVLKAFPDPVAESMTHNKLFPTSKMVWGLSAIETWEGLLSPVNDDSLKRQVDELALCCTQKGESVSIRFDEFSGKLSKVRIARNEHAKEEELSAIAIEGVFDNGDAKTLAVFPFLPVENPLFRENSISAIWRYYPWAGSSVAEVELEVEDCEVRRIFALMPNYTEDKRYCARGQRFNGKICAFGHVLRKSNASKLLPETLTIRNGPLVGKDGKPVQLHVDPDFMDTFDQNCYHSEISRSGFFVHGRYVSTRSVKAYGTEISCVSVKCKRIGFVLDVYMNKEFVPDGLRSGDEVEVEGWMYVDLTTQVDDIESMCSQFPDGFPIQPLYERGSGAPSYVRTKWTEEEKTRIPANMRDHNWIEYARKYLAGLPDVDVVEICPHNETATDFLIRQKGVVRRVAFFKTEHDKPMRAKMTNVDTLTLMTTPSGDGVDLEWKLTRNDDQL